MDAGGWDALIQVVERKLNANLDAFARSPLTLMVPVALGFVAYLMYRPPSALGAIQQRLPELRFALAGVLLAGVLGFALNDSGIAVPGMMLGVLNLLPIPLLDGGHLLYYLAEIVKGSPVSERTMEIGQRLGLALLLGLTFFAFYNDLNRLFTG